MRILHTSDWHLGRMLYGAKRYTEFEGFLAWLVELILEKQIDTLIIAGDIFDTSTPSNRAQALYYGFLAKLVATSCRHIVIIAGNHDSPTFLNAPKELLYALNVHVIATISDNKEDEIVVLKHNNTVEAIVCAVPYIHDRYLRTAESGETIDAKNAKIAEGLQKHYAEVCTLAETMRKDYVQKQKSTIPLIATGHLFATGGKTVDGDGVRDLYVGSLAQVSASIFPSYLDYVALGHLHVPQSVGGYEHIRYSGSPIAMGFGEAKQKKYIVCIEITENERHIDCIDVPLFQELVYIKGNLEAIEKKIIELIHRQSSAWLDIEYTGTIHESQLRERIEAFTEDSHLEIRRIKNNCRFHADLYASEDMESLDDVGHSDIFLQRLAISNIAEERKDKLIVLYNDVVGSIITNDSNAE